MKLIRDGKIYEPGWLFVDEFNSGKQDIGQVLPFDIFLSNRKIFQDIRMRIGVFIEADSDIKVLRPFPKNLKLIVIEFSSFADGRGFSLARRLRHSLNYRGEIWVTGNLIADQYALAMQCGIDAVLVDEMHLRRQPIEQWLYALENAPFSYRYPGEMAKAAD